LISNLTPKSKKTKIHQKLKTLKEFKKNPNNKPQRNFLQIMADSDINVHVQKRIAIDIIANVIVRVYIALTVIVKIVRILLQKITFQIDIKK